MFFKKKYIVILLVKEQSTYNVLLKKKILPTSNFIRYNKKTYPINIDYPTYSKGLSLYYFIDIHKEKQLSFGKSKNSTITPDVLDMIISQNIISQLTENLGSGFTLTLYNILIGLIIGSLIGFIVGGFY